MSDDFKKQGNEAFAKKDYPTAIDFFTRAIEADPSNHVLYSNRSASYASTREYDKAYDDGVKVTEMEPDWGKGWSRKGAAAFGLGYLEDAKDAYEEALKVEPTNAQAKSGLASVEEALSREKSGGGGGGADGGLGGMFKDPQLFSKLANNPKTKHLLADPAFMMKLQSLQTNPNMAQDALQDPRMMQVLAVMLGIDIQQGADGDMPVPEASSRSEEPIVNKATPPPSMSKSEQPPREPQNSEAREKKAAKEEADAEKAKGNAAYKARDFETAIKHYSLAWERNPDITYLTNLAAARFEQEDYDACIQECHRAIEEGRERLQDFKLVAKAFARIASAYQKKGDLDSAIKFYNKSLTEHRTSDTLSKLRATEKAKVDLEKSAYLDPARGEEAREEGNKFFKAADWPSAIKSYSEAIKRNPNDARGWTNRAATYIKLLSMPEALKDCDQAISIDPSFVRAYIRKGNALFAMHEYNKAIEVCRLATDADKERKSTSEIEGLVQKCMTAMYSAQGGESEEQTMERISRDPEIVSIIQDPVMQSILQQAKENPAALNDHMKNPMIREKIQKLMAAGIIRVGR